jgi:crotonobetainyl-CoA:carnitine CoA-transferase CaiB-like acyl-CoA transferase
MKHPQFNLQLPPQRPRTGKSAIGDMSMQEEALRLIIAEYRRFFPSDQQNLLHRLEHGGVGMYDLETTTTRK